MSQQEYTGGSVSYYTVRVERPTNTDAAPYSAECNDIIEALGMNYAEGNAFKALWRRCAARNLGLAKHGYKDGLYDAEKVVFFGQRMVSWEQYKREHCGEFDKLMAEIDPVVVANVAAFNADWPNEQRRQDAEDEDVTIWPTEERIDAASDSAWVEWRGESREPPVSGDQIVGVRLRNGIERASEAMNFAWSHNCTARGEFDVVAWRLPPDARPYSGLGGVMLQCPGCVATSCECRP